MEAEIKCNAPFCLVKENKIYDEWYCKGCEYNPKLTSRK